MKPLSKCLVAGSLAALALFGYYESSSIHSFFNTITKTTTIGANKKDVFTQSADQLKQSAPLIAEIEPGQNKAALMKARADKMNQGVKADPNTVDYLTHAV